MTNRSPGSQSKSLVQHLPAAPSKPHCLPRTWFGALLLVMLFAFMPASPANAAEYRAFWVDAWGAGFLNQSQVDNLLGVPGNPDSKGTIRDANCNMVIAQVRRRYDTCYPSGVGEPYFSSGLSPANFNALQAMINAAHDTTGGKKRIEVHCWQVTFATGGGTVWNQHRDTPTGSLTSFDNYWPTRDNAGAETTDFAFDPGHPLMLQYIVDASMDLVNNFDIDGIHYDYIRFTANNQGYNPTSIARYNARYGLSGQPGAADEQFKQWRRDQVSAVVRQVYAKIQKSKPWVKQSGSFVTWNPSPTTSTRAGFQATRPYYDVYSDWDSWMQEGIVDMAVPMTYYNWASLPNDYTRWMNFEKDRKFNRHMIIGPGTYLNSLANAILELQMTRDASPAGNHADGFSGYSYRVPYSGGTWAGFAPTLVSDVTPTWADIPDMPWKTNATKGHIMGTVTIAGTGAWADGAKVSLTGPVSRAQTNDGTGFYAFIDLTPGTYTVVASKTGYPNATGTVAVAIGAVTGNMYEQDLVLGTTPPSITTQPSSQSVSQGADATFTVIATGTAPLSYQWRFDAAGIVGATASTYTRASVQSTDAGSYSVIVTNIAGSVTSSDAILTVETTVTPPGITSQPASQTVVAGQNATFTVTASGTAPLSYQWRFNAAPIGGATDSTYTRASVQTTDAGSYSVVITNSAGSTNSADAVLTVNFSLTATATTGGTVSKNPNQASYAPNAGVTLTANADAGYVFTGWSGDASGTDNPLAVTMTANKTITANFTSTTDLILDNTDPAVTFLGEWQTGTGAGKYGDDYRFALTAVGGLSNVTYRPCIYTSGYYNVSIWYPQGSNRATNAPWSVVYYGGSTNVPVNQTANGGIWLLIAAACPFMQGTNGYVMLSNDSIQPAKVVMADAVRFTYVAPLETNPALAVSASGGGAVYKYPDQPTYAFGSTVKLVAAPAVGWNFSSWSGAASGTANPLNFTLTRSTNIVGNFASTVAEIIVDDPAATLTGSVWSLRNATGNYGTGYQRANTTTGTATGTATFLPTIVTAGRYDVYVWYPTFTSASTAAPFLVSYDGGTYATNINQSTGGGGWRLIASAMPFAAGTAGYVRLSNNTGESSRRVAADAVRWVYSANQNSPPVIIAQPGDQSADSGGSATFSVVAAGTPAPAYQWRFNGTPIPGATTSAYTRSNVQSTDAGSYSVVVSNTVTAVTSSDAVLTVNGGPVNVAPTISQQPSDQNVNQGSSAVFSVTASGTPAPAYQWRKNSAPIPGATDSSYTVDNAQPGDAGSYSVVATNLAGTATSADAVLTVNVAPLITIQPQGKNVNQSSNAVFSVTASGTPAPAYQWRKNSAPIPGATDSSYTVINAQPANEGSYSVVVTNVAGTATSADALLTVNVPPTISQQPQDRNVNQSSNAVFSVEASGTPAPAYQWRKNSAPIGGATDSSYTVANAQPGDAGSYSVVVTNVAGTATSADALLTVNVPPTISQQPQDRNVNQSSNALFSVEASGTPAPAYQWRKNSTPIGGATDSSYTVANAQPADAGSYSVVVTNLAGTVTSVDAVLAVNVPPEITGQPEGRSVTVGSNVTFTVTANGTPAPSYQWRFNGTNLAYATASAYVCNNAQTSDAGSYSVVVSNVAGTATSADAVLAVALPPPPRIEGIRFMPGGQIQLQVSGVPGHYAVEAGSNLVVAEWGELTNFTTTGTAFEYLDAETNLTQRFYRVRLMP